MNLRLQQLREEKDITQGTVAAILGVTRQAYSRYERGERELGYSALATIAKYFDVSVDYLLGNSNYYYPDQLPQKRDTPAPSLTMQEKKLLDNFHKMRPDIKAYFVTMSETFAQTPNAIIERDNKKA